MPRRVLALLVAASALVLAMALTHTAAGESPAATVSKVHDCRTLAGVGTRSNPWQIPARNFRKTVVVCPGFPLGQGAPDFYVFNVPGRIDRSDNVTVRSRPTAAEPAEVSLALDDLGPLALNIHGFRFLRGPYAYRRVRLADVDQLTVGRWYIRTERLRAVASAPAYRLTVDLR